jgi:NADH-quinone oxidoreductase subunit N
MWAPDVYDGAPTPITAYMAAAVKAAAFAAFLRVWLEGFPSAFVRWHAAIWWLAALTMLVGNVIALQQKNLKRMLDYSSIGHTGFILVGLAAGTPAGSSAFLFYLFAYTLATMGAFAVVLTVNPPGDERAHVDQLTGLWSVRPWLATAMAIFMLALLGFPVFGGMGFFAKWYVLQAALQAPAPQTRLAVILVLATVVSAGYYLYVVMVMFMRERPADASPPASSGVLTRLVIMASAILILVLGVYPDPVARLTRASSAGGASTQRVGATPTR